MSGEAPGKRPRTLGLTGSIGMGKSTTAQMFAQAGAAVYDADAAVHSLYAQGGGGAEALAATFPRAVTDGVVDRAQLSALVLEIPGALKQLEALIHPLLAQHRQKFYQQSLAKGAPLLVFDIPLLFETGGERGLDAVAVVTAAPEVQAARVLARPGMTAEKFEAIRARQLDDAQKRARADFIIDTGQGLDVARHAVADIFAVLTGPDWTPRPNET